KKISPRSRSERKSFISLHPLLVTSSLSERLSRTSIFTPTPLAWSAFINRKAAIAAPPLTSDVLIISTFIRSQTYCQQFVYMPDHLRRDWSGLTWSSNSSRPTADGKLPRESNRNRFQPASLSRLPPLQVAPWYCA